MNPEISVIIPVYNMEKSLSRCVESIISQTYQNFEIILVDDGSTDLSAEICDKFCVNDYRIRVIHKKNAGLPKARETGVSASEGKYICFIDADDFAESEYLEKLYTVMKNEKCDMVCCGFYLDYPDCTDIKADIKVTSKKRNINSSQYIKILHNAVGRYHFMWNKLFRKESFSTVNFPEAHTMFEDYFIMIQLIPNFDKITLIPECLYHYIQTTDSMVRDGFGKTYEYAIYHLRDSQINILENYSEFSPSIISFRLILEMSGITAMTKNNNYDYAMTSYIRKDVHGNLHFLICNSKVKFIYKASAICIVVNLKLFCLIYKLLNKYIKKTVA